MLKLKTEELELRGVIDKKSQKTNNIYYIVFCESMNGEPFNFLCRGAEAFPEKLDKGDHVVLTLTYNRFKSLEVEKIEKVGD
jgi:hypothetical protein